MGPSHALQIRMNPFPDTPRLKRTAVLFALGMSSLIALSGYYDGLNADTAVAYMNSSVRWTPFFWDQDRYGMLIPALTQWINDPLLNMVAQNILHITCSILSFFLLATVLFPRSRAVEIGMMSTIGYVTLSGLPDIKEFLTPWQIYTPAMALGLLGMLALPNWWIALPLALLTGWCNFAINVFLGVLVVARAANDAGQNGFESVRTRLKSELGFVAFSFTFGWILKMPYAANGPSGYRLNEPLEAIQGWIYLLRDYFTTPPWTSPWLPLLPIAFVLSVLIWLILSENVLLETQTVNFRAFMVGAFTAFAYAFLVGSTHFAQANGYPRRYLIPSLMVWMVSCCGFIVHAAPMPRIADARVARLTLALLMISVILFRFGWPSPRAVHQSLAHRLESRYSQIPLSCTHVAGNYYRVWESVFYSRLKDDRHLWGITYRSGVTRDLWALERFKDARICYWQDNEGEAMEFLQEFGLGNRRKRPITDKMVELL